MDELEIDKMEAEGDRIDKMLDDYLDEGYDRMKDDKATEVIEVEEVRKKCEICGGMFEESELNLVKGFWTCKGCEDYINEQDTER